MDDCFGNYLEAASSNIKIKKVNVSQKDTAEELLKDFSIKALLSRPVLNTMIKPVLEETYRPKLFYYSHWTHDSCRKAMQHPNEIWTSFLNFPHGGYTGRRVAHMSNRQLFTDKRIRTKFTSNQLRRLEEQFARRQYIVGKERECFASELGLDDTQVKVWFQNRRTKWRKQEREKQQQCLATNNFVKMEEGIPSLNSTKTE